MRKTPHPIALFIGFLTPIVTVLYIIIYGVGTFIADFPPKSFFGMLAVSFCSIIIYYVQLMVIKKRRKMYRHEMPEHEFDINSDDNTSDLLAAYCSKCRKEGFYLIDDMTQPHLWVCWNCSRESSTVWCDKCGMGGNFVKKIALKPKAWKCPECKTEYPLPEDFYKNPLQSMSWMDISLDAQQKYFNMQKKFQIQQLRDGLFFIMPLALSFAWTTGIMKITEKEITRLFAPFASCALFPIFMFSFIGMWYGMILYPKYVYQFYKKWKASL